MGKRVSVGIGLALLVVSIAPRTGARPPATVVVVNAPEPSHALATAPLGDGETRNYFAVSVLGLAGEFWSNRTELREAFAKNGYELPSNVSLTGGFAFAFVLGGPRVEFGGAFGGQDLAAARGEAKLRPFYGWLDVGHDLWRHEHTSFFPFLGVGVDEVHVEFRAETPPMLEDQMTGIGGKLDIWRNAGQLHGGVGFEHMIPFEHARRPNGGGGAGLVIGARVGYRTPFSEGQWGNDDYDFTGGPRLGAGGPFVLVAVGGSVGGWSSGTCEERCGLRRLPGTELSARRSSEPTPQTAADADALVRSGSDASMAHAASPRPQREAFSAR